MYRERNAQNPLCFISSCKMEFSHEVPIFCVQAHSVFSNTSWLLPEFFISCNDFFCSQFGWNYKSVTFLDTFLSSTSLAMSLFLKNRVLWLSFRLYMSLPVHTTVPVLVQVLKFWAYTDTYIGKSGSWELISFAIKKWIHTYTYRHNPLPYQSGHAMLHLLTCFLHSRYNFSPFKLCSVIREEIIQGMGKNLFKELIKDIYNTK